MTDGGLSGATMDRPVLQRLLADIAAGRVDTIVVYKIDRLTRSLADFAKIVEILDARSASFVLVTQQFNTTTSMGRLTLNVLLSFAQDKIAASKKKGMWMGGVPPIGYRVQDRKLVIIDGEAEIVRSIFRRYAELARAGTAPIPARSFTRGNPILANRRPPRERVVRPTTWRGGSSGRKLHWVVDVL
jgi:site-specific DNA recombinase